MAPAPRNPSYRFARAPAWIVGHALALVAVLVMVNLGLWQLRRLEERQAVNERVKERMSADTVPILEAVSEPIDRVEFRRVSVKGSFDASREVLVGYRTNSGLPGYHVVTPLVLEDDPARAVLVNRGFVPLELADRWPARDGGPPAGTLEVVGLVRESERAKRAASASDTVPKLSAVDIPRIASATGMRLLPVQIELMEPTSGGWPQALPAPDLGDGPHLSYALQWFAFSAIAATGWVIVVRRRARVSTPEVAISNFAIKGPNLADE